MAFSYTFVFNTPGLLEGQGNWSTPATFESGEVSGLNELGQQAGETDFANDNLIDLASLDLAQVWDVSFVVLDRVANTFFSEVTIVLGDPAEVGNFAKITVRIDRNTDDATLSGETSTGTDTQTFPSFPAVGGGDNINLQMAYDPVLNELSVSGLGAEFGLAGFIIACPQVAMKQLRIAGVRSAGTEGYAGTTSLTVTGTEIAAAAATGSRPFSAQSRRRRG